MSRLVDRFVSVTVDDVVITGLRVVLKVEKSSKPEPNTLDVTIYNLAEATRKKIQTEGAAVEVVAGYAEESGLIFRGQATLANHSRNDADWITRLQSGDGVKAQRQGRIVESFRPNTSMIDVAKRLADRSGLDAGNFYSEIERGNLRGAAQRFGKGYAVSGLTFAELVRVTTSMGYELSVQEGSLQLVALDETFGNDVIVLRDTTGLVGSPEVGEKGIVKARALMQHKLAPARRALLQSLALEGHYRIEKVTFNGDTHGQDWYADLEMRTVKT